MRRKRQVRGLGGASLGAGALPPWGSVILAQPFPDLTFPQGELGLFREISN